MTPSLPKIVQFIVCGAPSASSVDEPIRALQSQGWSVHVVLSPSAVAYVDVRSLEQLTGHAVETTYRSPDVPKLVPDPDVVIVAPATFNTLNKAIYGIADTLAVSRLCEFIGSGLPVYVVPCLNEGLRRHPAWTGHPNQLRDWGVRVVDDVFAEPPSSASPVWHLLTNALWLATTHSSCVR